MNPTITKGFNIEGTTERLIDRKAKELIDREYSSATDVETEWDGRLFCDACGAMCVAVEDRTNERLGSHCHSAPMSINATLAEKVNDGEIRDFHGMATPSEFINVLDWPMAEMEHWDLAE